MSPAAQAKTEPQKLKDRQKPMLNNYPSERKSPVRLSEDEQYAVYKYCIENRCVYQVEAAIEFRVEATKIANEIVNHFPKIVNDKRISSYHVKSAVENTVGWQKRLGKLPIVPLETAELEQLRIAKIKNVKMIEEYKLAIEGQKNEIKLCYQEIERLKQSGAQSVVIVDKIRHLLNGAPKAENKP